MMRRLNRRLRRFFVDTPNINLIVGVIGLLLLLSLGLPLVLTELFPSFGHGALCTNLPAPKGGNSRSLLALANGHQKLKLELEVVSETINQDLDEPVVRAGEPLLVRLTFVNEDIGPITLYYQPDQEVVGSFNDFEARLLMGLVFEIRSVSTNSLLNDAPAIRPGVPQKTDFTLNELYNLPAHSKCFIEFRFSRERLITQPGEYRIRAFYRNRQPGTYIPATPSGNRPAPTPLDGLNDQGVWVGTVQSNEVRFIYE
jgi:hypothetical protein